MKACTKPQQWKKEERLRGEREMRSSLFFPKFERVHVIELEQEKRRQEVL